ncbi:hypothetical protein P3T36_004800 [Kitasatospora sp. MAP12-15]|nr:hypothetical protein [Kitasatospora sp. MAP12-44]
MSVPAGPTAGAYQGIVTDHNGDRRPTRSTALDYDPNVKLGPSRGQDWPFCQCGSDKCPDKLSRALP